MAFYLKYEWNGKDAYPLIRQAITERPEVYNEEQVRNEMFLALDYYVTESSGHNSEYNWWFRKRPDLIEKYCTHGTGWNPGEYAYILKSYEQREKSWRDDAKKWFDLGPPDLAGARPRVRRVYHQCLAGRRAVRVQRERGQHRPDHQPAAGRLCRGAGLGQQEGPDSRRTSARCRRRSPC